MVKTSVNRMFFTGDGSVEYNRKCFFHIGIIFVPIIMESDKVAIVFINPESGNHGTSE